MRAGRKQQQSDATAPHHHFSELRLLRSLHPQRPLHLIEALHVAERQAQRLLRHVGVSRLPVPTEVFQQLSGVSIHRLASAPVAGASYWNGRTWIIVIDGRQCDAHQRLTLAHEFKHVIDAGRTKPYIDEGLAESVADFFARCLLAPRPWVKAEIGRGVQELDVLSRRARMTCHHMAERLSELGLVDQVRRLRSFGRSRCRCRRAWWR